MEGVGPSSPDAGTVPHPVPTGGTPIQSGWGTPHQEGWGTPPVRKVWGYPPSGWMGVRLVNRQTPVKTQPPVILRVPAVTSSNHTLLFTGTVFLLLEDYK